MGDILPCIEMIRYGVDREVDALQKLAEAQRNTQRQIELTLAVRLSALTPTRALGFQLESIANYESLAMPEPCCEFERAQHSIDETGAWMRNNRACGHDHSQQGRI